MANVGVRRKTRPFETPNAKIFERYLDFVLRSAKVSNFDRNREVSNNLHPNLEFTLETLETVKNNSMSFLDMEMQL